MKIQYLIDNSGTRNAVLLSINDLIKQGKQNSRDFQELIDEL